MHSMQQWLNDYSQDHQHPGNRLLHWICVPAIAWSVIAALWTIPVPSQLGRPGLWAATVLVLAFAWYWRRSHRLGGALLIFMLALAGLTELAWRALDASGLRWLALAVFVLAWIGQFVGHLIEGRRPSFFTDLAYLLVGPAWLMDKLLRRFGSKERTV